VGVAYLNNKLAKLFESTKCSKTTIRECLDPPNLNAIWYFANYNNVVNTFGNNSRNPAHLKL